ncbi:unnamed protein product [Gordionus sp. m RMFG-2023]
MYTFKITNIPSSVSVYDILYELTDNSDVQYTRGPVYGEVFFEFYHLKDMLRYYDALNGRFFIYGDSEFMQIRCTLVKI